MDCSRKTTTSLKSIDDLVDHRLVDTRERADLDAVGERYAVAITPAMVELINPDDPDDPIARQFVPDVRELDQSPQENADPIGDGLHTKTPGLVHRYPDRVLLKLVDVCPVYCRFCFRREMVGPKQQGQLSDTDTDAALAYIGAHPEIWEVIVTGGDPFVLSARRIRDIVTRLGAIEHVKIIRWHTRVPVVAPDQITVELVDALTAAGKTVYVALHANHPRELTTDARAACRRLIDSGVSMVSQTVLLRGINDNAAALAELMRAFVETGIKPYYLHHGDLAPGTRHFRTTLEHGQAIMRELRGTLSGLAQPTYVLDIPGGHGKVPATAGYVHARTNAPAQFDIEDPDGRQHSYSDCDAPSAIVVHPSIGNDTDQLLNTEGKCHEAN